MSNYGQSGTTVVYINGNTNQTISGASGSHIPNLNINSSGGTVTFTGSFNLMRDFTYTSGTVDFGTSTLVFNTAGTTQTINANNLNFYNITFSGQDTTVQTVSNPFNVLGTLTFNTAYGPGALNGSYINLYGNLSLSNYGRSGSTNLFFVGGSNSTLSCVSGASLSGSTLTVQKDSGFKVSQTSACSLSTSGQNFTVQSGEHDMAGYNLTVNNNLTVNVGATLTASGGTYSPSSGAKFSCLGTCNP